MIAVVKGLYSIFVSFELRKTDIATETEGKKEMELPKLIPINRVGQFMFNT